MVVVLDEDVLALMFFQAKKAPVRLIGLESHEVRVVDLTWKFVH